MTHTLTHMVQNTAAVKSVIQTMCGNGVFLPVFTINGIANKRMHCGASNAKQKLFLNNATFKWCSQVYCGLEMCASSWECLRVSVWMNVYRNSLRFPCGRSNVKNKGLELVQCWYFKNLKKDEGLTWEKECVCACSFFTSSFFLLFSFLFFSVLTHSIKLVYILH